MYLTRALNTDAYSMATCSGVRLHCGHRQSSTCPRDVQTNSSCNKHSIVINGDTYDNRTFGSVLVTG